MASADQRVILQEMNGCIREIIDTLPGNYRSVIVLSELEGLKNQEIARSWELPCRRLKSGSTGAGPC